MGKLFFLPNLNPDVNENQLVTIGDLDKFGQKLLQDLKMLMATNSLQSTKRWLKSNEVRKMLKISPGTLQTFRDKGTIPFTKIGGVFYYDATAIDQLLTQLQTQAFKQAAKLHIQTNRPFETT